MFLRQIILFVLMPLPLFIAGGFGIINMIDKIKNNEYMGFENLCKYHA